MRSELLVFYYETFVNLRIYLLFFLGTLIYLLVYFIKKPFILIYKIHNFFFTTFLCFIYFLSYLGFLIVILYVQINRLVDLKALLNQNLLLIINFKSLSLYNEIIIILFLLIILLIWLLVFVKLRIYLNGKIWQLYMYCNLIHRIDDQKIWSEKFNKFCENFNRKYSFQHYSLRLAVKLSINDMTYLEKFLTIFPIFILLAFIILECYFNDFVLYYIFYYLPIFILVMYWIKISSVLVYYASDGTASMLIERYYGAPKILYVNITEEEEYLFTLYMKDPHAAAGLALENLTFDGINYIQNIEYFRRFEYISGKPFGLNEYIYYNSRTEKYFQTKDLQREGENYYVKEDISENSQNYKFKEANKLYNIFNNINKIR